MKLSTRYGLVGLGALGVLSLVHWARRAQYDGAEMVLYGMGVLPNVAAAIAVPFVLLSIWADQHPGASFPAARRSFVVVTLGAGVALIAWEWIQQSSRRLVFDPHDIGATILGLGVSCVLFTLLTPKAMPHRESPPLKRLLSDPRLYVAWLVVLVGALCAPTRHGRNVSLRRA